LNYCREEHRPRVLENRAQRQIMTLKGVSNEQVGEGGIMRSFMIGTPVYIFEWSTQKEYEMRRACGTYGGRNMLTACWWGKRRGESRNR
jgi:hypothetical protein